MIADQLLDRLEFIHGKSFVYRDIKPENFLVGLAQRADKLYIIDFELAQKFVDYTGSHVRLQPTKSGTRYGSPLFLSIHGHQRLCKSVSNLRAIKTRWLGVSWLFVGLLHQRIPTMARHGCWKLRQTEPVNKVKEGINSNIVAMLRPAK